MKLLKAYTDIIVRDLWITEHTMAKTEKIDEGGDALNTMLWRSIGLIDNRIRQWVILLHLTI